MCVKGVLLVVSSNEERVLVAVVASERRDSSVAVYPFRSNPFVLSCLHRWAPLFVRSVFLISSAIYTHLEPEFSDLVNYPNKLSISLVLVEPRA